MFFNVWEISPVKNTKKVEMHCAKCNNTKENEIYEEPIIGIGIPFMKKPLLAAKRFWLVCPVCHTGTKKITREQMNAHKVKE